MRIVMQASREKRHCERDLSTMEAAAGCALDWRRVAFWRRAGFETAWCKAKETKLAWQAARDAVMTQQTSSCAAVLLSCMQLTCNMHMPA